MGKPMTSTEWKWKSLENKLLKMSEDEKLEFKQKKEKDLKKAMQAKTLKDRKYDSTRTSWL